MRGKGEETWDKILGSVLEFHCGFLFLFSIVCFFVF